jgi:hypothetical protein
MYENPEEIHHKFEQKESQITVCYRVNGQVRKDYHGPNKRVFKNSNACRAFLTKEFIDKHGIHPRELTLFNRTTNRVLPGSAIEEKAFNMNQDTKDEWESYLDDLAGISPFDMD